MDNYIELPILSNAIQASLATKLTKGSRTIFCIDNGDFPNAQAAVNSASPGDTILIGVKSGGWGDLVIPAGKKLSIVGLQSERSIYAQIGSLTFSPTTGTQILENELYLDNLYISAISGNALFFDGSAPARIRVNNCYILASGSAKAVLMNNTNINSSVYLNECSVVSSSSSVAVQSSVGYVKSYRTTIDCTNLGLQVDSGTFENSLTNISCSYTGSAVSVLGGSLLAGYSLFSNSAANSSGVQIATGAVFASAFNTYSIPSGSGYCVRGTGVHAYGSNNYSNSPLLAYNVKVQNTLTNTPYTLSFTLSP